MVELLINMGMVPAPIYGSSRRLPAALKQVLADAAGKVIREYWRKPVACLQPDQRTLSSDTLRPRKWVRYHGPNIADIPRNHSHNDFGL